jgi:glycosyltransferase involved in cell wall biosynthesis
VVAAIIDSIRKSDYPQELLEIFVVAHNCSDNTAAIARSSGAHVYEYDNPEEKTMGYAIRYLFKCIEDDFGSNSFDGFFIFNADNSFDEKYFDRMNDAFEYYDRKKVISSFRQASNFN